MALSLHSRQQTVERIPWTTLGSGRGKTPRQRLLRSTIKRTDGHWLWVGADPRFSTIHCGRKLTVTPRRALWYLVNGVPPRGQLLRVCDFDGCINPDHMEERGVEA